MHGIPIGQANDIIGAGLVEIVAGVGALQDSQDGIDGKTDGAEGGAFPLQSVAVERDGFAAELIPAAENQVETPGDRRGHR